MSPIISGLTQSFLPRSSRSSIGRKSFGVRNVCRSLCNRDSSRTRVRCPSTREATWRTGDLRRAAAGRRGKRAKVPVWFRCLFAEPDPTGPVRCSGLREWRFAENEHGSGCKRVRICRAFLRPPCHWIEPKAPGPVWGLRNPRTASWSALPRRSSLCRVRRRGGHHFGTLCRRYAWLRWRIASMATMPACGSCR